MVGPSSGYRLRAGNHALSLKSRVASITDTQVSCLTDSTFCTPVKEAPAPAFTWLPSTILSADDCWQTRPALISRRMRRAGGTDISSSYVTATLWRSLSIRMLWSFEEMHFVLAERALWSDNSAAAVSVSNNGILIYLGGRNRETDSRLIWVDRSGDPLAVEGQTGPPSLVTLSPDQRMAAVVRRQAGVRYGDVWLRDMDRGLEDPFTFDGTIDGRNNVVWSPDGSRIAFSSTASESVELYISDVPASGPGVPIFGNGNPKILTDWSRDGYLLYTEIDPETGSDLWYLPLAGNATGDVQPVAFLRNEWDESSGQIAPNGQWIAYVSNETGSYEVYVQQFPFGAAKWRISTGTGTTQQPRWSRDGSELFYVTGAGGMLTMMAAPMRTPTSPGSSPVLPPRPLFEARINHVHPRVGTLFYSVSNDGERFLINQIEAATETGH